MAKYQTGQIRNIALIGHGGDGKTSLAEAMLFLSKGTDRLGKPSEGNTVCDFDPEEKKRTISISAALATVEWNNVKINLLDTPGFFDFVGEVNQCVRVADSAIIVVSGKSGCKAGTELSWDAATGSRNIPKSFFINKMDDENANFDKALNSLRNTFGISVCPVFVPIYDQDKLCGYFSLMTEKAYAFDEKGDRTETTIPASSQSKIEEYKNSLAEALAETSDELMEKFFAGEAFTQEETVKALHKGFIDGAINPVFSGSAVTLAGIRTLLDIIETSFSSPLDKGTETLITENGDKQTAKLNPDGQTAIYMFKTVADPFVGKMSYFKVMNGTLKKDSMLQNLTTGQSEKLAKVSYARGAKQFEVDELACGDIGITSKLINTNTNDTLTAGEIKLSYSKIEFPKPYLRMAVVPKAKGDEDKISSGINKLLDEDYTVKYENNSETKQICLYGLGETQLDILTSKLKNRFGVSVDLAPAKVPYRETIKKKVSVEGKHKKQSGGHGQYGHVKIEFSPGEEEGLEFTETIFGGSVPKNFHPAVEKGLQESMSKGILAGYPVIKVKANLFDGSYHDVDSSEMSFKLAANLAFKEGMRLGNPILLEPIGILKVSIPESMMGDIIGDINKRRGRILGTDQSDKKGYTVVEAEAPTDEMGSYSVQLRAITQGRGSYSFDFLRYEEAPAQVAQKIITEAKKAAESE
ncbi:MAG: elongation factor G [Clostridiales bacterium GWF2_38_85]|nr:MAG: elongation factor G [Clostridiales bacterium GWF2_38_85]HBL83702.1 elongation factor G [Clostridiales bacterium]